MRSTITPSLVPRTASLFTGGPATQSVNLALTRIPIVTWEQSPIQYGSDVVVWMRDDPVLRHMASRHHDEREYWLMRQDITVANSIDAVVSSMLAKGYALVNKQSRKRNSRAEKNRVLCQRYFAMVNDFHSFMRVASQVVWDGWLPVQMWWKDYNLDGKTHWVVDRIFEMPQPLFGVTPDRELAWLGLSFTNSKAQVLNEPPDKLAWMYFSAGSTRSPYGTGQLRKLWLYWWAKQRFFEYFGRGFRNAVQGIPIFDQKMLGSMPGSGMRMEQMDDSGKDAMAQFQRDALGALQMLEEYGAIVTQAGMEFKNLINGDFVRDAVMAISHLELAITIGIEGQHLTSSLGEKGGARALGDVQLQTKMDRVKDVARHEEAIGQEILSRLCRMNISADIDPDDIPDFQIKLLGQVDPARLKAYTDMGGKADAVAVAEDWGLPILTDDQGNPVEPILSAVAATPPPGPKPTEADKDKGGADQATKDSGDAPGRLSAQAEAA
jgi:hypothetical protein